MPPAELPEGRYGRRRAPWRQRAVIVLAAVLGTAVVIWLGLQAAHPPVSWKDVGFTLNGDRSVTVEFYLMRSDPRTPVTCRVHALNAYYGEVGVVTEDFGPGSQPAQTARVEVATTEQAVTGVVDQCWPTP